MVDARTGQSRVRYISLLLHICRNNVSFSVVLWVWLLSQVPHRIKALTIIPVKRWDKFTRNHHTGNSKTISGWKRPTLETASERLSFSISARPSRKEKHLDNSTIISSADSWWMAPFLLVSHSFLYPFLACILAIFLMSGGLSVIGRVPKNND